MQNTVLKRLSKDQPFACGDYLHVVIAVICRANNVLISKRADDVHLGGLWEFPGGKVEVAESSIQALHRELNEELGIAVIEAEVLIRIPCAYPEVDILLEVWKVSSFQGRAFSKENQPLQWVSQGQLSKIDFPEINKHIIHALLLPNSYVISENRDLSSVENKQQFMQQFRQKCQQSCRLMQLRMKNSHLSPQQLQALLYELIEIASAYQLSLQINSSHRQLLSDYTTDNSLLGLHLSSDDLNALTVQQLDQLRIQFPGLISASCHNLDDVLKANTLKLDFIVLSTVKKTASHPQAKVLGWDLFEQITVFAQMPVYALGGLELSDIEQAKHCGGQGIAGISCFCD